ncbi:unnamed protein product [Trichogramma brassicae]|uniref:Anoctamin n=1 Tax=Trichogramma brassicae TaxID=86971 RepID=A0A6H5IQ16_9HYME|nr:unnamed protein product [Trichogramma brassicae]
MFPSGSNEETLMWLLGRLRAGSPGLVVHVRHHASSDSYGFYLTAPFSTLLKAAEEVHLPKRLQQEYGGGLKEFVGTEAKCFEGSDDAAAFFTTQERQSLVLHLLHTLRAGPHDSLPGLKLVDGQAIIPKCLSAGIISQVFPLHELPALEKLQRSWVRAFLSPQPLDDIARYFGVKITMYFAWLGHYTTALIVPAAVGVIYWVGIIGRNQAVEDVAYVLFSIFNVIWATVYLETWKRRGAELAYRWGTLDQRDDLLVEPRPLFTDWWDARLEAAGYGFWLSYVPKVLLAIVIALMDEAYFKVAVWLNDLGEFVPCQLAALLIARQVIGNLKESAVPYLIEQLRLARLSFEMFGALSPSEARQQLPGEAAPVNVSKDEDETVAAAAAAAEDDKDHPRVAKQRNISQAELESSLYRVGHPTNSLLIRRRLLGAPGNAVSARLRLPVLLGLSARRALRADGKSARAARRRLQAVLRPAAALRTQSVQYWNLAERHGSDGSRGHTGELRPDRSQRPGPANVPGDVGHSDDTADSRARAHNAGAALRHQLRDSRHTELGGHRDGQGGIFATRGRQETVDDTLAVGSSRLHGHRDEKEKKKEALQHGYDASHALNDQHASRITHTLCCVPDLHRKNRAIIRANVCAPENSHPIISRKRIESHHPKPTAPRTEVEFNSGRFVVRAAAAAGADGGGGGVATASSSASGTTASCSQEELRLRQQAQQELVSARAAYRAMQSSQPGTPTLFSTASSAAGTPGAAAAAAAHHQVPTITETSTPQTPGSTGSGSDHSSTFLAEAAAATTTRDISNLPRGSIPGGERGRRSREWLASEQESSGSGEYSHHLTIGPHGGVDWIRRLGLESGGGRKSSDSEIISGSNSGDEMAFHRSTDCIVSKDLAGSSDSEMRYELRFGSFAFSSLNLTESIPPWTPNAKNQQKYRSSPEREPRSREKEKQSQQLTPMQQYQQHRDSVAEHREREREKEAVAHAAASAAAAAASTSQSTSAGESSRRTSSQDDEKAKEEREAKKTRVKQSLMKRARSVAIFSLKLKESQRSGDQGEGSRERGEMATAAGLRGRRALLHTHRAAHIGRGYRGYGIDAPNESLVATASAAAAAAAASAPLKRFFYSSVMKVRGEENCSKFYSISHRVPVCD